MLTYAGFKLGQNWASIEPYIKPFSYGILGLLILAVIYFIFKNLRTRFA